MNARLHPEVLLPFGDSPERPLPLATEGVKRYVWHGRHARMLVEVREGEVFVDGQRVVPIEETLEALGRA